MSINIVLFAGCLVLVLGASEFLARGIDRVGSKLGLSNEILGILTALGADSPEISSAIVALVSKRRDLGVGIVLGSNLFNLAALLGLGALVSGRVVARRAGTVFNGIVAVAVTLIAGALITGLLGPVTAAVLMLLVIVPYIYILATGVSSVKRLTMPASWKNFLIEAVGDVKRETSKIGEQDLRRQQGASQQKRNAQSWKPALWLLPAVAAIVLGSIGLIKYATALGESWLPQAVLGTFVLASLTGLPNSLTAVRLARSGSGAAVITETFNSNTINLLIGLLLPALVFGEASPSPLVVLDICWLVLMTVVAVALSAQSSKLTRNQGMVLIALYFGFIGAWVAVFVGI